MVGQPLKHVTDIDDNRAFGWEDRQPLTPTRQQLQPSLFGTKQQRDQVDVLMRARTNAIGIGRNRRIMEQPQHRIAIAHRRIKPVRLKPQMKRNRRQ